MLLKTDHRFLQEAQRRVESHSEGKSGAAVRETSRTGRLCFFPTNKDFL